MNPLIVFVVVGFLIGFDKGGVPGLGSLAVAFAVRYYTSPAQAIAIIVPILAAADVAAVFAFRKDARIDVLKVMVLPCVLGIGIGLLSLGKLSNILIKHLIGYSLIFLTVLKFGLPLIFSSDSKLETSFSLLNRWISNMGKLFNSKRVSLSYTDGVVVVGGICAGFLTIMANVAGPIVNMLLLSYFQLNPSEVNGTRACLFLSLNVIKVSSHLLMGNINGSNFHLCLIGLVTACLFTYVTKLLILPLISSHQFETISWLLTGVIAFTFIL